MMEASIEVVDNLELGLASLARIIARKVIAERKEKPDSSAYLTSLSEKMNDIVRIDRMTMAAEARRIAILREIERLRTGFGRRLRGAIEDAETIELEAIEKAPALEPA